MFQTWALRRNPFGIRRMFSTLATAPTHFPPAAKSRLHSTATATKVLQIEPLARVSLVQRAEIPRPFLVGSALLRAADALHRVSHHDQQARPLGFGELPDGAHDPFVNLGLVWLA